MTSTSRSEAGLPSTRKRIFAVSRAYRSLGCCTGLSSMPVPASAFTSVGAPTVTKVSTRRCVCSTSSFAAFAGMFAAISEGVPRQRFGLPSSSQRAITMLSATAMRYVPVCRNSRSKLLRVLPLAGFCGATGLPSGPMTDNASICIAPWLNENRSSAIAASTVTHPPEFAMMVCDGSSHARAASLVAGANTTSIAASFVETLTNKVFMCACLSRIERQRDRAEFRIALGRFTLRGLDGPLERNAHRLAATDFAHRLHDDGVLAGLEARERRLRRVELQQVLADGTSRARQAIDGHFHIASAATPPLAQIRQPLRVIAAHLVPERKIRRDGLVSAFDPDGQVRPVVLGHGQLRNFHAEAEIGGVRCTADNGQDECRRDAVKSNH